MSSLCCCLTRNSTPDHEASAHFFQNPSLSPSTAQRALCSPLTSTSETVRSLKNKIFTWQGTHLKFLGVNTGFELPELSTRSTFKIDPSSFSNQRSFTLNARETPYKGEGLNGRITVDYEDTSALTTVTLDLNRFTNSGHDICASSRPVILQTHAPITSSGPPDNPSAFTIKFEKQSALLHNTTLYQRALTASGVEFSHPKTALEEPVVGTSEDILVDVPL